MFPETVGGGGCFVNRKTSIGLGQCGVWYNMNDQGFSVRFWTGEKIFLFIAYIIPAAGCKSFVSNDQATQPERNAIYSPPSRAKSWEPLEMSLHKTSILTVECSDNSLRQASLNQSETGFSIKLNTDIDSLEIT
jgi:hypothetical protein